MDVNPSLLVMARESRGKTQVQLAEAIGVSHSKVSKYETGSLMVTSDDLAAISSTLRYTTEFFFQSTEEYFGFASACVFHRKPHPYGLKCLHPESLAHLSFLLMASRSLMSQTRMVRTRFGCVRSAR